MTGGFNVCTHNGSGGGLRVAQGGYHGYPETGGFNVRTHNGAGG